MKLEFLKSTELEDRMKSGYNFTKRAFFDVMNEESRYVTETLERRLNPALCVLQTYFRISL